MTIKAYALSEYAAGLQVPPDQREWASDDRDLCANPAWQRVNGIGWQLCCPRAFEATWNGGPHAEDVEIRFDQMPDQAPIFVRSQLGGGMLTFHTGYQMLTAENQMLWVRGPINAPKDGLYPLETLVNASLLPATIVVHWKFARPHQTVRFVAGEPFCAIVPYAQDVREQDALEVIPVAADPETYAQAFDRVVQDPALQHVVQRLSARRADITAPEAPVHRSDVGTAPSAWPARLVDPPPVSCICPTYGRVDLLEEAIYSFLLQDYPGRKELIVLNDYDQQTLAFDHPDVHVINVPMRFHSVGEKYNAAATLASYDLVFVWHDDDVYLPHRLSFSVAHLVEKRGFFKADRAWFWNDGQLSGPEYNVFHGASCWTRALFIQTRGYPHVDNGYDGAFEWQCEEARPGATASHRMKPEDVYYIYRWAGTGSYHLSGYGQSGHEPEQVVSHVRQQAVQGQIPTGCITLNPRWKSDYAALVLEHLNSGQAQQRDDEIPFPHRSSLFPPLHHCRKKWPRACLDARTRQV